MSALPKHLPALAQPAAVRHAIARALLGVPPSATLGAVTLMPHQVDAVARISLILQRHHVALLADDVGLGKTFAALAVAQRFAQVHIIAPAALLPMWRSAVARAQCAHASIESLQSFSRSDRALQVPEPGCLVVIDEAHHLRNRATARYRAVAAACAGLDVLMLTATPIHNHPQELRHLLALSLGGTVELSDELLAELVVRRTRADGKPAVVNEPTEKMPHDPRVLNAILALPAPLPAHDGSVACALIKLGLLRAWCSSDAALEHALSRRVLRSEALRQALESGRHPTSVELRSWLVGDDDVQLAFPELLARHEVESAPLRDALQRHLDAVRALRTLHRTTSSHDNARAAALRGILQRHGATPVVAFSQYAETVRAIGRALSDIAGVGVLTSRQARIASGPISRRAALEAFAPLAHGRSPPPEHQRIRLLLTTDLLAEGVNLQDAGVVVHLDMPWTHALQRQRVGRCARVGSPYAAVSVYAFEPPAVAEAVLQLKRRLRRKARFARRWVGSSPDEHVGRSRSRAKQSAPEMAEELREELLRWSVAEGPPAVPSNDPMVGVVRGTRDGFLTLLENSHGEPLLVGGHRRARRAASYLRRLLRACDGGAADTTCISETAGAARARSWRVARRAIARFLRREGARTEFELGNTGIGRRRRQLRVLFAAAERAVAPGERRRVRAAWHEVDVMLGSVRGVAAEWEIEEWIARFGSMPAREWIGDWRGARALSVQTTAQSDLREHSSRALSASYRVVAVLLLVSSARESPPVGE